MDKQTLSNYGWITICVLVIAVMVALATPFGSYIKTATENTTNGVYNVEQENLSIIKPQTEYKMLENEVKHDSKGNETSLYFRSEADYSKFTGVIVDGQSVDPSNYTSQEGSTIVNLKPEFYNTLEKGSHTLTILSKDGKASGDFRLDDIVSKYGNRLLMINRNLLIGNNLVDEAYGSFTCQWYKCGETEDVLIEAPKDSYGYYLAQPTGDPMPSGTYYYTFTTLDGELYTSDKITF